jgi:hypothetical protein
MAVTTPRTELAPDLAVKAARFRRNLRAGGLSPKTERTYLEGVTNLSAFLVAQGMPTAIQAITREHSSRNC